MQESPLLTASTDFSEIRKDFPILNRLVNGRPLVYLDNAASSQKPRQVIDAIVHYYSHYNANVHRGVHTLSQEGTDAFEKARANVATFIGAASTSEIIFTSGTTDSINLLAYTIGEILQPGDEILLSVMEHHSNMVPWQIIAERKKLVVKYIPLSETGEWDLSTIDILLTSKTRLVAVNHVSNALGTLNPVEILIEKAHALGAWVMLDGAQAVPHMPVDVVKLNADFYAFSGHKMCAPTGIGVLYGKTSVLEQLPPFRGGGEMIKEVKITGTTYNTLPFYFEAGTPHIEGVIGLGAAIDYLSEIGMQQIDAREHALLEIARNGLSEIPGIRFYGTSSRKSAVISFLVEGIHPYDMGVILDKMGVAVRTGHHCTQPIMEFYNIPGTVRASFAFYNDEDDVHRLLEAVKKAVQMLA